MGAWQVIGTDGKKIAEGVSLKEGRAHQAKNPGAKVRLNIGEEYEKGRQARAKLISEHESNNWG